MVKTVLSEETFVRHLPFTLVARLAELLNTDNLWERLASKIPKTPDSLFSTSDNFEPRYTMCHIVKLSASVSSTKELIKDWGNQNCRVKHLVQALKCADLKAASSLIQQMISPNVPSNLEGSSTNIPTHETPDIRPESSSTNITTYESPDNRPKREVSLKPQPEPLICKTNNTGQEPKKTDNMIHKQKQNDENQTVKISSTDDLPKKKEMDFEIDDQPKCFPYDLLTDATGNFDQRNYHDGGNLIGKGGFGTVFIGTFSNGKTVAIKCLEDSTDDSFKQFTTEVETLAKFRHPNLVRLLGYSMDEGGPHCLIYEYMPNGSLEERLACRFNTKPLSNDIRLEIIKGTARGLEFLHNGGLVHRDIKSANILLDEDFKPKVGDFATARLLPDEMTTQIIKASVVIGTRPYLAPEALSFIIDPSLDSYSFGVVILEILTGLPVTDPNREEVDLKVFVQEHCSEGENDEEPGTIYDLLDTRGGTWNKSVVDILYSVSCRCLVYFRKKRLKMTEVLSELEKCDGFNPVT